jgi:dihydrofolate synthase/folylpolyglutamate synthase
MRQQSIANYNQSVNFLQSLSNASDIKNRRERLKNFKSFLAFLGNPQNSFKTIHITGTSGKGSVTAMLHNILNTDGKNTGSYTSPHTTTFCERIKVGDKYINETELTETANILKNKMDEFAGLKKNYTTLNFLEAAFCLAILYFQKRECEYAVVEACCGGRYDTTNVFSHPTYAIITNIGYDHAGTFGGKLKDIAYEKAGIIKRGAKVITGESRKNLSQIFKKEIMDCKLWIANFKQIKNVQTDLRGMEFVYGNQKYKLKLLGEHQVKNAALAIECADNLRVSKTAIKKGLEKTFYPARLEIISRKPLIVLDGAHNADKLAAGLDFIKKTSKEQSGKRYLILGMAKSKEVRGIINEFADFFDEICLTRFSTPFRKCFSYQDWQKMLSVKNRKKTHWFHSADDALLDILGKMDNNNVLLITGSIFLAGELRKHWYDEKGIVSSGKSK